MNTIGAHRRGVIAGALALIALTAPMAAGAGAPATPADDMALGQPNAPVTVIEYASLGCPHCGAWSREVFPAFKKKYIDTGRARFVLREVLFGEPNLAAAGFLTARCAGKDHYFQVVEGVFAALPQIARDGDARPSILRVAGQAGLSPAKVDACLSDHAALDALQARSDGYVSQDKITGTPTFVVGGKMLVGVQSLADLDAAIAAATPKASARRRRH